MEEPEIHIRIYDQEIRNDDDFIGEAIITTHIALMAAKTNIHITRKGEQLRYGCIPYTDECPTKKEPQVNLSIGHPQMIHAYQIQPSAFYEELGAPGEVKSVDVVDINASFPLCLGTGPGLPAALQGIFWLHSATCLGAQGMQAPKEVTSALISFGGDGNDGGGCSTGELPGNAYKIRVTGDRVWACSEKAASMKMLEDLDLVYHFSFDDNCNPTKMQMYPEVKFLAFRLDAPWILNLDMELQSDERFAGSVCWKTKQGSPIEYLMAQVIDAQGQRKEQAFDQFVKFQSSGNSGPTPGKILYHHKPAGHDDKEVSSSFILTHSSDPQLVGRVN